MHRNSILVIALIVLLALPAGVVAQYSYSVLTELEVSSVPDSAQVYVDTIYKGITSDGTRPTLLFAVEPGTHTLLVRKEGYSDDVSTVTVYKGNREQVMVSLGKAPPAPTSGEIAIISTPGNASVVFDGTVMGTTSVTGDPFVLRIIPGTHTVELSLPGFPNVTRTVDVTAGARSEVNVVFALPTTVTEVPTTTPTAGGSSMLLIAGIIAAFLWIAVPGHRM
ncbi:MAG: PEGA domain-containing protein [Methanoregulaceae archaeon]|nr:PEGA domain-containing protein [Methanoregulaceae archaeon]